MIFNKIEKSAQCVDQEKPGQPTKAFHIEYLLVTSPSFSFNRLHVNIEYTRRLRLGDCECLEVVYEL